MVYEMRDNALPTEWEMKRKGRKILAFGINASFFLIYKDVVFAKIRYALKQIKEASDSVVCLFSPDESVDRIKELDPGIWEKYQELIEYMKGNVDVIYDAGHEACDHIEELAGYYGGPSDLAGMCQAAGKPVMFMDVGLVESYNTGDCYTNGNYSSDCHSDRSEESFSGDA